MEVESSGNLADEQQHVPCKGRNRPLDCREERYAESIKIHKDHKVHSDEIKKTPWFQLNFVVMITIEDCSEARRNRTIDDVKQGGGAECSGESEESQRCNEKET